MLDKKWLRDKIFWKISVTAAPGGGGVKFVREKGL